MAPTSMPVTNITRSGVTWPAADGTAVDIVNGNTVPNGPDLCFLVTNTDAATQTITFTTPGSTGGLAIADDQKSLTAGQRRAYGPFPRSLFGDNVEFTASAVTVKVIPFQAVTE